MRDFARNRGLTGLYLAALLFGSVASSTAATIEGIAGWEGDAFDDGYGFVTAGLIGRDSSAVSIPVRVTGSYLYYRYHDVLGDTRVQAPGASALAGMRRRGTSGSVSLTAGGEVRRERREPVSGNGIVGVVWRGGLVAQAEGNLSLGRFQPTALLVYSGASRYWYGRGSLRWQLSNRSWAGPITWFAGVEGVGQGNADADAVQAGAAVECALVRSHLSLSLHGGAKRLSTGGTRREGGYVGVGLYRAF